MKMHAKSIKKQTIKSQLRKARAEIKEAKANGQTSALIARGSSMEVVFPQVLNNLMNHGFDIRIHNWGSDSNYQEIFACWELAEKGKKGIQVCIDENQSN